MMPPRDQPQAVQQAFHPLVGPTVAPAGQDGQADVVVGRQRRNQIECLKDETDFAAAEPRQLPVRHGRQIGAVDDHAAFIGRSEPRHDVQQRALARAAGAHDGDEFPFFDQEADILDGLDYRFALTKAFGCAFDANGNPAGWGSVNTKETPARKLRKPERFERIVAFMHHDLQSRRPRVAVTPLELIDLRHGLRLVARIDVLRPLERYGVLAQRRAVAGHRNASGTPPYRR